MSAQTSEAASTPPGRTGTKAAEHAESILAAAHRLVSEKGEDFTTQELIKEANVALKTFYRHYGSKDQLILAMISDLIFEHCKALARAGRDFPTPVERLHFYVTSTLGAVTVVEGEVPRFLTAQHWRLHQQYPAEVAGATRPFTDLILSCLAEGRVTGEFDVQNPERSAWLVTKLVMSVFHHYAFAPDEPGRATAADEVWDFCIGAVGGRAGS